MFGLDKVALIAGVISGAVLAGMAALPIAYTIGKHDGRQQAAVAALELSVKALRERNDIDAAISTVDAVDLCRDIGLSVDDAAECVRRLATPDAKP